ncbi:hypothetical protein QTP86_003123 [Hemibagrus guttatus]|nr:hypothetical protein QTP86_003123 [Hemibagrus guttatus]
MRVAIALYKLGGCREYRSIAYCFGVHKTTVMKFVYMFCKGMVNQAIRHFIKVPSLQVARAIAKRFESKFCMPQQTCDICGRLVNFIVLGGAAYPLLE